MTGSIICGVDDSNSAKGAARVARRLAAQLGLGVVFVRVLAEGSSDGVIGVAAARLHHLAERASDGDGARWLVEVGHPADRLLAVAEEEEATLIVVGSTGPRSSLLGSISADVSRRAPCPVVVVAPGADVALSNGNRRMRVGGASAPRILGDAGDFAGGIVRFGVGGGKRLAGDQT